MIDVETIRRVVSAFYDAMFDDVMIGYMFRGQDKARLTARETELMAAHFGLPGVTYTGRPLEAAHARHKIMGAQFDRRAVILAETLDAFPLAPEVKTEWLRHTLDLRDQLTSARECKD